MDLQQFVISIGFISILVIATSTMALADQSILIESFSTVRLNDENPTLFPRGYVDNISWVKKVSSDGVIEIDGIIFSVINEDNIAHSFEICAVIEGPLGMYTPSLDSPLACTNTGEIAESNTSINQSIDFPKGVKVSELIDISITIQELQ